MEVKEAIEFLEHYRKLYYDTSLYADMDEVMILLQQGEKYRQIVEDIEYELNWHKPEEPLFTAKLEVSKDEEYCNETLDLIANIKQKYFPKGIIDEVVKGISKLIKESAAIAKEEASHDYSEGNE